MIRRVLAVAAACLACVLSLAARGEGLAAFDGRCIPVGGVAPPPNAAGIIGRRAFHPTTHNTRGGDPGFHPTTHNTRGGDPGFHPTTHNTRGGDPGLAKGRLARPGAAPDFHHGLPGAQEILAVPPLPVSQPFAEWLTDLRAEALTRGIRPDVVDAALAGVQEPVNAILERDRTQAEFTLPLDAYLKRRLTPALIRTAQAMYTRHRTLLAAVGRRYGVSPKVLVAVWGLESNFGRFAGVRPTVPALATLAYDPRRAAFFRSELFSALEIVNRGDIDLASLKGSWAGALGQPQFMPSSYLRYAQDFDGDGRRDIWRSPPDVFASVAFYLQEHGWSERTRWGREVVVQGAARAAVEAVPRRDAGCRAERVMSVARPLTEWRRLGVRAVGNAPLPAAGTPASLVAAGSRSFLVFGNYEAILGYNCAHTYALSVALLSDRLK